MPPKGGETAVTVIQRPIRGIVLRVARRNRREQAAEVPFPPSLAPLTKDDTDAGIVTDRELPGAPRFFFDMEPIGMKDFRSCSRNFPVELINRICFDGNIRPVFGGKFRAFD